MELIVPKEKDSFISVLCALIMICAIILIAVLFRFTGPIAFVPAPFLLFTAAIFTKLLYINYNKVEHEYSISAGIFNIDKILNQIKRRPIIKIPVSDILSFGKYDYEDKDLYKLAKEAVKFTDCGSGNEEAVHYYFTCNYASKGIHMYVITPNDKFLGLLKSGSSVANKALMQVRK